MEAPNTNTPSPDRRIAELEAQNARLVAQNAALEARLAKLEQFLADRDRNNKRQAAPFSKGPPKPDPKTPGRKPGEDYGTKAFRSIPDQIDEVHDAPLPAKCPRCGGEAIAAVETDYQYQVELPRRPIYRRFNIAIGKCACCNARVQGRHPLQTSDALGCCASQVGPHAQATAVMMNKHMGVSYGKIAWFFNRVLNIPISRGGPCQAVLRAAERTEPACVEIVKQLQNSQWIVQDETGWRIGGKSAWMHTAVGPDATAYLVDTLRGYEAAVKLINENYAGKLIHDGWSAYDKYKDADHQTCLSHLIRRCDEMIELCEGQRGVAAATPRKIKQVLMESLAVRDQRDAGMMTIQGAIKEGQRLRDSMEKLTETVKYHAGNERLCKHVWKHLDQLFTFLKEPGLDATNWRAEQAIRPAVVNRKVWGGNRTEDGARAQGVLLTVLETARRRGEDVVEWLGEVLRAWPGTTMVPGG